MRTHALRIILLVSCLPVMLTAACRPTVQQPAAQSLPQDAQVVAEARTFMDGYARDLLAGDRTAIAARYDRTGAWIVFDGTKSFLEYDAIVARYAGAGWSPPATFEWRDLSFEPVGSDAVAIIGEFLWRRSADTPPLAYSYTAVLERQDGELRIRVEDEKRIAERQR